MPRITASEWEYAKPFPLARLQYKTVHSPRTQKERPVLCIVFNTDVQPIFVDAEDGADGSITRIGNRDFQGLNIIKEGSEHAPSRFVGYWDLDPIREGTTPADFLHFLRDQVDREYISRSHNYDIKELGAIDFFKYILTSFKGDGWMDPAMSHNTVIVMNHLIEIEESYCRDLIDIEDSSTGARSEIVMTPPPDEETA